jgi:release factor glutamine methyltransferase
VYTRHRHRLGSIAVTLALETKALVAATDVSLAALRVAQQNAAAEAPRSRRCVDLGARSPMDRSTWWSRIRLISERDRRSLPPEVREHEPAVALFGGDDGRGFRADSEAARLLRPAAGL